MGFVDQAGGEGEALFPAAGELAGELVTASGEPEAIEAALHGRGACGHGINTGNKIEIFADAEVLVVAEALGHVADVAFDLGLLGEDIVTKTRALAAVGREQSAKHADECSFARAIGSKKSVNLTAAYLQINGVDHGFGAESLGDTRDVDSEASRGGR